MKAGPIGGKKQDGKYKIDCRFNKDKLKSLINKIYEYRNQIDVTNENAEDFIKRIDQYYDDLFIYLDPPYVEKGSSLYKNSFEMKDHISLCNAIKELDNKWFVTYDNNDLIKDLYSEYTLKLFDINYSALVQNEKKMRLCIQIIYDIRLYHKTNSRFIKKTLRFYKAHIFIDRRGGWRRLCFLLKF